MNKTSWSKVFPWYNQIVGKGGHYYHEHIILPRLQKLITIRPHQHVLDVGCGQGVYSRTLPKDIHYTGIDLSLELIQEAQKLNQSKIHEFFVADATLPLPVPQGNFDHVVSILALQNIEGGAQALANMVQALKLDGDLTLVLNHPAFRIPRQSSWETDPQNKLEYRRLNRYLTPLEIPINAHPGVKNSPVTWSFHQPISFYVNALADSGCAVTRMEEWISDKASTGKAAKAENRARAEFPLFLAIKAKKI